NFALQSVIASASLRQKNRSLTALLLQCQMEQLIDLLPTFRLHRLSKPNQSFVDSGRVFPRVSQCAPSLPVADNSQKKFQPRRTQRSLSNHKRENYAAKL